MTKDKINNRIRELQKQRDILLAQINQIEGAVIDCEYWLTQLDENNGGGDSPAS